MWTAGGDYLNIAFRLKDARDGVCLRHPTQHDQDGTSCMQQEEKAGVLNVGDGV